MANRRRGGFGFSPSLTGPGTIFTIAFITLAAGMGLLFTRGVTPKSTLTDPGETGDIEVVEETPIPGQKGLQLKTIKFKECASTVTIDLLLDRSGSMGERTPSGQTKISRLREAVGELIKNAQDMSIIGFQSFDTENVREDVPISYYKDVKSIVPDKLNALTPGTGTPTYEALTLSYNSLKNAIPKFPKDRKFNFIFISDGAPCPGVGCVGNPGADQDPRKYNPNPADEIKALGVNVYSLGIYSVNQQNPELEGLLRSVASGPEYYFAASSGDDVKRLLTQISNKICNQATTPTPTP
jgi:hypothetical protein